MSPLTEILDRLARGEIPAEIPADCDCREELDRLVAYLAGLRTFVSGLAAGDLNTSLQLPGPLAGSLKALMADLRHLTWQTQQVASGDFSQRVEFLGDFSAAFNCMVAALDLAHAELTQRNRELATTVTELQSTQTQLLQQEKMASIGQLAAGVAHEINNPMGFISSNLGTLERYVGRLEEFIEAQTEALKVAAPAGVQEALADIRKQLKIDRVLGDIRNLIAESADGAERVRVIVQNLKSFSRLDEAESQETDLHECLESTISIAWNELKYKATLERDYGQLPPVVCQPRQLNQVFLNLLINASHAIDKQGVIRVRTWPEGDRACIAISDTGCGIPAEIRSRIFEPFFTTKEVGKGTGLGLSISYDIVKKHNGTIEVDSTAGQGTTFTIRLPIKGE